MRNLVHSLAALIAVVGVLFGTPTQAQLTLLGVGSQPVTAAPAVLTLGTPVTGVNVTSQTTYVFSSVDFGAAAPNRRVVFGASASSGASTANIAAIRVKEGANTYTATNVLRDEFNSGSPSGLFYVTVPTGTGPVHTVEIDVTDGGTRCVYTAWPFTSTQSTPSASSGAFSNSGTGTSTTGSEPTVTVPTGGAGFAYVRLRNSSPGAITWSQTSGSGTEDYDASIGTNHYWGAWHTSSAGSQAFRSTWTSSVDFRSAALAWAP